MGLSWLLIIFVVALALAPLSHFAPSKRQRAVARMRERAAVSGLFVEYRKVPGDEQVGPSARAARGDVIYYGKRLSAAIAKDIERAAWIRRDEGWCSIGKRRPLPDILPLLPDTVTVASVDSSSCGIYWGERVAQEQEEQMVDDICAALGTWSESLEK